MSVENSESINLSALSPNPGSRRKKKRLGIGEGSGHGKTSGKGQKGAKSRSGYKSRAGFEGGQMPLYRRLPKIGFVSRKKLKGENLFAIVDLRKVIALGQEVDIELLREKGLVPSGSKKVKVVNGVDVKEANITLKVNAVTSSVRAAIEASGGKVELV